MLDDGLTEGCALLGKRPGICNGPLSERYAANAVSNAREIQHFENQINSMFSLPQQVTFTVTELDLTGWNWTSGDLVFEAAYLVIQLAILAATRYEEQPQATHTVRCAFASSSDDGQFSTGVTREVFVAGEPPHVAIGLGDGLHRPSQV